MPNDIGILKAVAVNGNPAKSLVVAGDQVTYTLTFPTAPVSRTLFDLEVTDTIPDGLDLVSVSSTGGSGASLNWTPASRSISGNFSQVDPGQQVTVTIQALVDSGLRYDNGGGIPMGHVFPNDARLSWYIAPSTSTNRVPLGTSSNIVKVSLPGLLIEPDNVGTGQPGSQVSYLHTLRNTSSEAQSVTISYSPSTQGWAWVWHVVDANNVNVLSGPFTSGNTIPGVPAGGIVHLRFSAFIPANTAKGTRDVLNLTARSVDVPSLADSAQDITTVSLTPTNLKLFKQVDKTNAQPGDLLTYSLVYLNIGTEFVSDVEISDPVSGYASFETASFGAGRDVEIVLPDGSVLYATAAADGDQAEFDGLVLNVNLGSLHVLPGERGVVTYKVRIK